MKKQLFQYAILVHPTQKQMKYGVETELCVEPKTILAVDRSEVEKAAAMQIPVEYKDKLAQIEILVRPF